MLLELRNAYMAYDYPAAHDSVEKFMTAFPRGFEGSDEGKTEHTWHSHVEAEFARAARDLKLRDVRRRLEDAVELMATKETAANLAVEERANGRSGRLPVPTGQDVEVTKQAIALAEAVDGRDDSYMQDLLRAAKSLLEVRTLRRSVSLSPRGGNDEHTWGAVDRLFQDAGSAISEKLLRMYPSAQAELDDLRMLHINHRSTIVLWTLLKKPRHLIYPSQAALANGGGTSLASVWADDNREVDKSLESSIAYAIEEGAPLQTRRCSVCCPGYH